jgi:hypothetical protein
MPRIMKSTKLLIVTVIGILVGVSVQAQSLSQVNNGTNNSSLPQWANTTTNRTEALNYCAALLISSIDKNQIELFYHDLTNQPATYQRAYRTNAASQEAPLLTYTITNSDIIGCFDIITGLAESTLNEAAKLLKSPNANFYISPIKRFGANIVNPNNTNETFMFEFYGQDGPVQLFEIRTNGMAKVEAFMEFYENGKLKLFSRNEGREYISFLNDGRWDCYFVNIYPSIAVNLKLDSGNTLRISSYNSSGLLPSRKKSN